MVGSKLVLKYKEEAGRRHKKVFCILMDHLFMVEGILIKRSMSLNLVFYHVSLTTEILLKKIRPSSQTTI
jgi:hypothetical protein